MVQLSSVLMNVSWLCNFSFAGEGVYMEGGEEGTEGCIVPSSMPYCSSSGLPVSLQMGKGIYCSSCFSFSICSPVSLFSFHQHVYPLAASKGR